MKKPPSLQSVQHTASDALLSKEAAISHLLSTSTPSRENNDDENIDSCDTVEADNPSPLALYLRLLQMMATASRSSGTQRSAQPPPSSHDDHVSPDRCTPPLNLPASPAPSLTSTTGTTATHSLASATSSGVPRRQSPLVHAGYALRATTILETVRTFCSFPHHSLDDKFSQDKNAAPPNSTFDNRLKASESRPVKTIQLLILGAGLDVTGFWAAATCLPPDSSLLMHVVEVDLPEVASEKKRALLYRQRQESQDGDSVFSWQFEEPTPAQEMQGSDGPALLLTGMYKDTDSSLDRPAFLGQSHKYTLLAADLRQISVNPLRSGWDAYIRLDCPCLILFELVLAYLGHDACQRVLKWCVSEIVGQQPTSAIVLWEPLGCGSHIQSKVAPIKMPAFTNNEAHKASSFSNSDRDYRYNVVQGYQHSYNEQFNAKLQRGGDLKFSSWAKVEPFGTTCDDVQERLKAAGLNYVHAVTAGRAAASAAICDRTRKSLVLVQTPELFDEHAGLALHLQSYTYACGFSPLLKLHPLQRMLTKAISWESLSTGPRRNRLPETAGDWCEIWITSIEIEDEAQVRSLYANLYEHLFDEYPAVRRMVKTALVRDLALTSSLLDQTSTHTCNEPSRRRSDIQDRFLSAKGDFLVAVQINREYSDDDEARALIGWRVLGGVGFQKWQPHGVSTEETVTLAYELVRFFVDPAFRNFGIGTALIDTVQDVIRGKCRLTGIPRCQLQATTLSNLLDASLFYESRGFRLSNEVKEGDLQMNTYVKYIAC